MQKSFYEWIYVISDLFAGVLAWTLFFTWRKKVESAGAEWGLILDDSRYLQGILIIPVIWLVVFYAWGCYEYIIRRSRTEDLILTFWSVLVGSLGLLFGVIYDDLTLQYTSYVRIFFWLFIIHFGCFYLTRLCVMTWIKVAFHNGKIDLNRVAWMVVPAQLRLNDIPIVSKFDQLLVENRKLRVDTLYITKTDELNSLLCNISAYLPYTAIKLHADLIDQVSLMRDISPTVKDDYYYLDLQQMSGINRSVKRAGDIIGSVVGLIILSPIMIYAAYKVRLSSKGPIFYLQERIGRNGEKFNIIKFRSMYEGAESGGEQLAAENDPRCTPWGLTMRKWRIDELPQFVNVFLGQMSIVGPRPERAFYIDQITREAPEYPLLLTLRPGITSWGQMRFGYARNIAEMKQRMRFDMLYVQHQSLMLDMKIMLMTIFKLLSGKLK